VSPGVKSPSNRRASAGALTLVCFLAALAPPAFGALWYESYTKAEEAIAREDWAEAVRQINLALEEKGDSSARARTYGVNFKEYFPYLMLGIAFHGLGDYDSALQALDTEERLGAIRQSAESLEKLEDRRALIQQAKGAVERERIADAVSVHLTQAQALERQGQLEEALAAVDKVLAIAGDDADALAAKTRLLDAIASRQEQRDREQKFAQLLKDGRAQLSAKRYQDAASSFNRALSLQDGDAEATQLLAQAQAGLRSEIAARQDEDRLQISVATALKRAGELESAGDYLQALDALQTVFALEPGNADALSRQRRLRQAQADLETSAATAENVALLIEEAGSRFGLADYEGSLSAANRALALDRENPAALATIQKAYLALSRSILGSTTEIRNFPPATTFVNLTNAQLADSIPVEWVRDARFVLRGSALDRTPAKIAIEAEVFDVLSTSGRLETADRSRRQPVTSVAFLDSRAPQLGGRNLGDLYMTDFTLPVKLDPGLWVFRVLATDDDGASSPGEHVVLYTRLWYKKPQPYVGLSGLLVLLLGGLYARRSVERNKRLTRRFNPYIAGAPIVEDRSFFGREQLVNYVLQRIHNNSILLYGERRIGKTSLQHRIKQRLEEVVDPEYRFFPVFVDLQGTPEKAFFHTLADDIFQELAPLLGGLQPTPVAGGDGYDYRTFVHDVRSVLKALRSRCDKKVKLVLLIDEVVDELNSYDPRTNQKLRSLFMKSFADSLVAVVSGVSIKKDWEREGSPWYNFFQEIEVKPFRREDAVELIENPIKGIFKLEPGVVDSIIDRTSCKPYLIQKVCSALVNRLHDERRRKITLADVEATSHVMEV
jgi:AAA+ ATPase superfamily predicted ATPase/tetratricopeptide (TPR) repeat protein